MTNPLQSPRIDELTDLPDVLVIWGGTAALAGVIELDATTHVLTATRTRRTGRCPGDRLTTIDATEAIDFLRANGSRQPA